MESKRQKKRAKVADEEVEEPSHQDSEDVIEDITEKKQASEKKKRRKVEKPEAEATQAPHQESSNTSTELFLSGFPFDTDIQAYVMENTKGVIEVRVPVWRNR